MPISFNQIPSNVRVPLVYIEFDNSRAVQGTPAISHRILILGQRLAAGTVLQGVLTRITNDAQPELFFGRGSQLAAMLIAARAANPYTEIWSLALDDNGAGVASQNTITVTGPATEAGTIALYVAGKRIQVAVANADTANAIAAAINAAINAQTDLPVTSAVLAAVVTLTARNKGEHVIDVRDSYYTGEQKPKGVGLAYVQTVAGAGNPAIGTAIAAFSAEWWNTIVTPWTDAANMTALEAELDGRAGPTKMIDAIAYTAFRGTHAATDTFGAGRNSKYVSCIGSGLAPEPAYVWAAVYGVTAAFNLANDPARPLQTLPLVGLKPPAIKDRWTLSEQNILLFDGIATFMVDAGGQALIQREVTMYQVNSFGVDDPSYLDVTTPATLSYIRYATRARITQKFPRHKLADDGTQFGPGQAIVTPAVIRAELVALMRELELAGIVENVEKFRADLIVERNANDRNRIDVLAPPDLVNQFRVFAEQVQFIL